MKTNSERRALQPPFANIVVSIVGSKGPTAYSRRVMRWNGLSQGLLAIVMATNGLLRFSNHRPDVWAYLYVVLAIGGVAGATIALRRSREVNV